MMNKKILVIDDDIAIVETLKALLNAVGYETITALDGEDGFTKAKDTHPALVILDLLLPRQDGFQVYLRLQRDEATAGIPVIALSSFAEIPKFPAEADGVKLNPGMFVSKPVEPGKLLQKIKTALA